MSYEVTCLLASVLAVGGQWDVVNTLLYRLPEKHNPGLGVCF